MFNTHRHQTNTRRRQTGSVLAEFGPALMILLIGFFFPLLNLLGLFTTYGACFLLNTAQANEAALHSKAEATDASKAVMHGIPQHWMKHSLGRFAGVDTMPHTSVQHSGTTKNSLVTVTTTYNARPWLAIPMPFKVPGMNAPFRIEISSTRPVESATNRGLNPPGD